DTEPAGDLGEPHEPTVRHSADSLEDAHHTVRHASDALALAVQPTLRRSSDSLGLVLPSELTGRSEAAHAPRFCPLCESFTHEEVCGAHRTPTINTLGGGQLGVGSRAAGRYRLERLLGQGGTGAVYAAFEEGVDREVAV